MKTVLSLIKLAPQLTKVGGGIRCLSHSVTVCQASPKVPQALWKLGKLNHVAIATPDLEKSTALYR